MSADFSGYDFALIPAKGLANSEMAFLKIISLSFLMNRKGKRRSRPILYCKLFWLLSYHTVVINTIYVLPCSKEYVSEYCWGLKKRKGEVTEIIVVTLHTSRRSQLYA